MEKILALSFRPLIFFDPSLYPPLNKSHLFSTYGDNCTLIIGKKKNMKIFLNTFSRDHLYRVMDCSLGNHAWEFADLIVSLGGDINRGLAYGTSITSLEITKYCMSRGAKITYTILQYARRDEEVLEYLRSFR